MSFLWYNMKNERIDHINIFRWLQYGRNERKNALKILQYDKMRKKTH